MSILVCFHVCRFLYPVRTGETVMSEKHEEGARNVIKILDRILADNERIKTVAGRCGRAARRLGKPGSEMNRTANLVIAHYSNLCAVGGGASGLPGLIPVVGTVLSVFGTGAIDAIIALKFEIEMVLALFVVAGRDIDDPVERKIACLMACESLDGSFKSEREPDWKAIVDVAMSEYSTRELSKTFLKAISKAIFSISAKCSSKKYFPVVGIVVGASMNKVLTEHTGHACWRMIQQGK